MFVFVCQKQDKCVLCVPRAKRHPGDITGVKRPRRSHLHKRTDHCLIVSFISFFIHWGSENRNAGS